MSGPLWLVMAFSVAVSFLMSGMEAGVLGLNRLRIRQMMRAGNARARLLHGYLEQPESFLWAILVGNTLANLVATSLAIVLLHRQFPDRPGWFAVCAVVAAFLFYAWCELLPKMLFSRFPNRLTLFLVPVFRALLVVLRPMVMVTTALAEGMLRWTGGRVFTGHLFANRDELRRIMQEPAQGFTSEERVMINRVMDLQNLTVGAVTLPWAQTIRVDQNAPMSEAMHLFREHRFSRLPVCETRDGRERVAGVLSLRRFLFEGAVEPNRRAADYMKPALYLDEDMRLEDALRGMQRSGHRFGVVLGRDRREIGVVTLEGILKALFGEVKL